MPLLDAIKQIPAYAKFLKELCTQKRKSRSNFSKPICLPGQANSIITHMIPKLKDPGTPTISCTIGNILIERALLDLGASVNILPGYLYDQFGIGELKPSPISLQFADRSVKLP